MTEGKQDLRIKKTQRALATALLALLELRSFGKISVNDICTEAMVSRSTFYAHFQDKYALLLFCVEVLKLHTFAPYGSQDLYTHLYTVLENVQQNVRVFRNLVLSGPDRELIAMMQRAFHEDFEHMLAAKKIDPAQLPGPTEILSTYYAAGLTSALVYWVSHNLPYSTEEMARCLTALLPAEGEPSALAPVDG